jgi:mannose-6-phosphate isomerase-like protein (cupin superfamily)
LDGVCERYIVRRGQGILEVDGERQLLTPGDQAVIPAGAAQRIENTGDGDLEFYCLCTPRFFPESYVNLETDAA